MNKTNARLASLISLLVAIGMFATAPATTAMASTYANRVRDRPAALPLPCPDGVHNIGLPKKTGHYIRGDSNITITCPTSSDMHGFLALAIFQYRGVGWWAQKSTKVVTFHLHADNVVYYDCQGDGSQRYILISRISLYQGKAFLGSWQRNSAEQRISC